MTRRRISKRERLLTRKVGVRFTEKTYQHLLYLVENTNTQSVGELVRAIVLKEKILFFATDNTMSLQAIELAGIRKELNAIGNNVNQITYSFHTSDSSSQQIFHALRVAEQYKRVEEKVDFLSEGIGELARQWLERTEREMKIEIRLPDFDEDDSSGPIKSA